MRVEGFLDRSYRRASHLLEVELGLVGPASDDQHNGRITKRVHDHRRFGVGHHPLRFLNGAIGCRDRLAEVVFVPDADLELEAALGNGGVILDFRLVDEGVGYPDFVSSQGREEGCARIEAGDTSFVPFEDYQVVGANGRRMLSRMLAI